MRSSARPVLRLVLWVFCLALLLMIVNAFRSEAGDWREEKCNRVARTEAAIEGSDGSEAKARCLAETARHAVFFAPAGAVNASHFS